jgi:2-polyprenyl-6-hydroxyphenyl methylase/3-demethylubiquinone-9 3-methyltransferase
MSSLHKNSDPHEIIKFDAMAKAWWKPDGEMALLHQLNPLRLEYILKHCPTLPQKKILDIGCGGGILTESLAQLNAELTGIDLSPSVILAAEQHAKKSHLEINYQCISTEEFCLENAGKFDVIVCMELLEHVPEPNSIISACAHMLKTNGLLFLSTINRTLSAFLTAIAGAEYLLQALPKGTHHYQQFIRPSELSTWALNAGLSLKHLQGIGYNPFNKKFSFSNSVKTNYIAVYQKQI